MIIGLYHSMIIGFVYWLPHEVLCEKAYSKQAAHVANLRVSECGKTCYCSHESSVS